MSRIDCFWQQCKLHIRSITMKKAVLFGVLPVLVCMVACFLQGKWIGEVSLADSLWNDELFYFKQVESILEYGYPRGYYGFNESRALELSFAAWSPVLVFPWVLWGLIFGWNMLSPVLCNMVLLSLACFSFVWLTKPTWKKLGVLAALFCLFTPFSRYMLSGMPEVICFSILIVFYGLVLNYMHSEKTYKLVLLFVMSGLMTLMRPYLLLFVLLPALFWVRKGKWKALIGSGVIVLGILGVYAAIHYYLSAAYLEPLFALDWLIVFFEDGLMAGLRYNKTKLFYTGITYLQHLREGLTEGLASGTFFMGHLVMLFVMAVAAIEEWRKNKWSSFFWVKAHLVLSYVGMFFAQLLMKNLTDGSKHSLTFIAAGLFVVAMMETKYFRKAIVVGLSTLYLFCIMAVHPYDYQVPFESEARTEELAEWAQVFEEKVVLDLDDAPSYKNVVAWVYSDNVGDGRTNAKWQMLYALPKGCGISCCLQEYVHANLEAMQCKYLFAVSGGQTDEMCKAAGYEELHRDADAVLYRRYE